jgi:hypothetical protein
MSARTRAVGLAGAVALVAPIALLTPSQAATAADAQPSVSAGDWLAAQVQVDGDAGYLNSSYLGGEPDPGIAADAIYSFARQGEHEAAATQLRNGLELTYGDYVAPAFPDASESGTYVDAGRLAKVVIAASVFEDQNDFGGEDLQLALEDTIDENGRAVNQGGSQQGATTVFAQTYAVEALDQIGSAAAAQAGEALAAAQCDDGGFPFDFDGETCASDTDTTALAILALDPATQGDAIDGAVDWLVANQLDDGAFGSEFGGVVYPSVSSTLLAAQALTAYGQDQQDETAALRAAGNARSLQLDSSNATGGLADEVGALLFDAYSMPGIIAAGELNANERTGSIFAAAQAYGGLEIVDGTTEFTDVLPILRFFPEITWLSAQKITTGYADGTFQPSSPVLREQMAAFLYRYVNGGANPDVTTTPSEFSDVATGHVFKDHIAWLADEDITTGYADGTFRPGQPVLREQMAAFLYRLAGEPAWEAPATSPFTDIPTSHVFYDEITWLAELGITTGYDNGDGTKSFRGSQPVLREQMATFLYRYDDTIYAQDR